MISEAINQYNFVKLEGDKTVNWNWLIALLNNIQQKIDNSLRLLKSNFSIRFICEGRTPHSRLKMWKNGVDFSLWGNRAIFFYVVGAYK